MNKQILYDMVFQQEKENTTELMCFTWENRPLQFRFKITKWIAYVSLNIEDNRSTPNKDIDDNER